MSQIRILTIGDVVGPAALDTLSKILFPLRNEYKADFVIVNGENAAPGNGIDIPSAKTLLFSGADVITTGNHIWQKKESVDTIRNKTVLILGTGDIGRTTAKKLKVLGAKEIFGIRRKSKEDFLEGFTEIFDMVELDYLLPKADIVICCLPETEITIGILNKEMLSLMKENSVLVNVGRGSLIVTDDLIGILEAGKIKGAVLDVFENEPLPENSKLWDMKNVIITPHIAGPSFSGDEATKDKIWKICFENIESYLQGGKLRNVVDFKIGY